MVQGRAQGDGTDGTHVAAVGIDRHAHFFFSCSRSYVRVVPRQSNIAPGASLHLDRTDIVSVVAVFTALGGTAAAGGCSIGLVQLALDFLNQEEELLAILWLFDAEGLKVGEFEFDEGAGGDDARHAKVGNGVGQVGGCEPGFYALGGRRR